MSVSVLCLSWLLTACAPFGVGIERAPGNVWYENLGGVRYRYEVVGAERVVDGDRIFVSDQYSGWGADGLRTFVAQFYPTLRSIAGQLGVASFDVVDVGRDRFNIYIISLTVVLRRTSAPSSGS